MQNGSMIRTERRNGQSVWEFRLRDRTSGRAVYRRIVLGTTQQFATATEARESIAGIVLELNVNDIRSQMSALTISQLVEHYRRRELSSDNTWKTYSTKQAYEIYLKRWILPKWRDWTHCGSADRGADLQNGDHSTRRLYSSFLSFGCKISAN